MAALIEPIMVVINDAYDYYLATLPLADERTKGWFLVDSPTPTIILTILYLAVVWVGPKLMTNRQAFKLNWALVPYNLAMSALNVYIFSQLVLGSTRLRYSYACQPITDITNPEEIRISNAVWWYYFSKLLEFNDTLFVILRKKNNQLSFLHVYHHSSMFLLWWIGVKWVPSGSTFLPATLNSFIHVLMYSYYGLSALGPAVSKFLWWKRYLTIMQLIQFGAAMVFGTSGIYYQCNFPLWMQYALVLYMIPFIVLFLNFYAKAYIAKGKRVQESAGSRVASNGMVQSDHSNGHATGTTKKIQ